MKIFFIILFKLIPLYAMILLGYISTRYFKVAKEHIAKLLIYVVSPVVVFYGTYNSQISFAYLSLPILFFVLCSAIALAFFQIGTWFYKQDPTKNLLALSAGTANSGYFGLPVALFLFGDQVLSLVVVAVLGFQLFESSLGFYLTAKGQHSVRESVLKVLRLPTLYALFAGLLFNYLNIPIENFVEDIASSFKGAYTVLGMMIIGMGLAAVQIRQVDFSFLAFTFLAKFVVWPVIVLAIVFFDKNFLHWYNQSIYNIFILMSIVPLAANTVALSSELNVYPDKAALAVLLSSLFALFFIPLMSGLFVLT